ncbi:hypothetical protein BDZ91DRAFT_768803 [Kalaharituber pfeilii]|nr:hypothetical protein BDZ91DRAFT_768803 [Kalaharituber pfeilii]
MSPLQKILVATLIMASHSHSYDEAPNSHDNSDHMPACLELQEDLSYSHNHCRAYWILCLSVPAITSTTTKYCPSGGCSKLQSTDCQKAPTATVIPPCPTECPELCPIPIQTVAVACTTTYTLDPGPIYTLPVEKPVTI